MFSEKTGELESVIGPNSEFRGDLNIKGGLKVDGTLNGIVNAESVVLGQTATVKGDITAKKIIVGGKIEGNLRAEEIVEIKSTGKVLGEIFAKKISIMEGGVVNAKVEMKVDESKVAEFEPMTKV